MRNRNRKTMAEIFMVLLVRNSLSIGSGSIGFVLVDDAGLHDEGDVLKDFDVLEGVAFDGDDVGPLAGFDGADAVGPAHEVGGVEGACLDGGEWGHAELVDVDVELMRVE